ncbi:hypothetical protein [Streptacidiphilus anmyonensis]|uniref:hypothetical protein n=1 Tax=Streptacidiphilus anmyonensis TaxID=405782 RepID=UPI0005A807ED|nr:hypothetical protein [Streptacidiphilus anmyonensis]
MTKADHRSTVLPAGTELLPGSTRTVIIVIVVIAAWAALVANGAPPEAAAIGLGAAARAAQHLASTPGRSPSAPRRASIAAGRRARQAAPSAGA